MKQLVAILTSLLLAASVFAEQPRLPVTVVLPFKMIGNDTSRAWVGDAVRENIQSDLLGHRAAALVAPVAPKGAPRPIPADTADAAVVAGRAVKADLAVFGTCQINDTDLRITGQVVDVAAGKSIGAFKASGTLRQLFDLEDQVTDQILDLLGVTPPPGVGAPTEPAPELSYRQVGPQYTPLDDADLWSPVYSYPSYAWVPDTYFYTPAYVSWYPCYAYVPTFCAFSFSDHRFGHHHDGRGHDDAHGGNHASHDGEHTPHYRPNHGHPASPPVVRPRPTPQGGGSTLVNGPSRPSVRNFVATAGLTRSTFYQDPVSQLPRRTAASPVARPRHAAAAAPAETSSRHVLIVNRAGETRYESRRGEDSPRARSLNATPRTTDIGRARATISTRTIDRDTPTRGQETAVRSRDIVISRPGNAAPSRETPAADRSSRSMPPARSIESPRGESRSAPRASQASRSSSSSGNSSPSRGGRR